MLKWNEVRKLIVVYLAPSIVHLGFSNPGRTMRRFRSHFVDIVDFRCGKWNDQFVITFGCGLKKYVKNNPKPWECIFYIQPFNPWSYPYLFFQDTSEDQINALQTFLPIFAFEVERWFGLFPNVKTAIEAASNNKPSGPDHVAMFNVPSRVYDWAIEQLTDIMNNE